MQYEPIELGMANAALRARRTSLAEKLSRGAKPIAADAPVAAVIDEVFADYEELKVEPAIQPTLSGNARPLNQELVANIATQLAALDRQREQLTQLLRSIDTNAIAD